MDESILGFLVSVAKHPVITNTEDAIEPGHKEQCCELYIKLLEIVFDFFDNIPNSLKENVPGYDTKIFEEVKLLQVKIKQILAKHDIVVAQESESVNENGKNEVDKGFKPHSIRVCIENEGHNSGTRPKSWTLQGLRNDLLNSSSLGASSSFINSSCSRMTSQGKGENNRFSNKPFSFTIEEIKSTSNRDVPSSTAEKIMKPLTVTEAQQYVPVAQKSVELQAPQFRTDSFKGNKKMKNKRKLCKTRDDNNVPMVRDSDANIIPKANTVNINSASRATKLKTLLKSFFDEDNSWQRYRKENFEKNNLVLGLSYPKLVAKSGNAIVKTSPRNYSLLKESLTSPPNKRFKQQKSLQNASEQSKGEKILFRKPPSVTIMSNKNIPLPPAETFRNAPEILTPLTAIETSQSKYAPVAGSSTKFQPPQNRKKYVQISTKHRNDVPYWHIGNDANFTPASATVNNDSVSIARGGNEDVGGYIDVDEDVGGYIDVDEDGWQRYREEDFIIEKRNLSELVEGKKEILFKNPSRITFEPSSNVPPSTSEAITKNAPEITKYLTATETSRCAPKAHSSEQYLHQALHVIRSIADSIKDNPEDSKPKHTWDKNITGFMPEAVEASVHASDAVASTSKADVLNRCIDIHIDEDGWPEYRPEDFEENIEDIGSQNPQEVNVMEESEDVNYHANIQNDGLTGEFDGLDYPHSSLMMEVLHETFGLESFRPNQLQIINASLLGNDCFVLMPTGSGKSLCYQLPALLMPGVTIVISPLKSLILDQVNKLLSLNISAAHLSGDLSQSTCVEVYQKLSLHEPTLKLLYVTPEKISSSNLLKSMLSDLYSRGKLARFVIDEAHCVSQWGHDFRPDYKRLSVLRAQFPQTSIIALTATATPRVRTDILHQLQVRACKWFLSSIDRPNLAYRILMKDPKSINQDVIAVIKLRFAGLSGIVYCLSRKDCEKLSTDLREAGVLAAYYHGGLSDHARAQVQDHWLADKYQVICATIAFGMGVDKADVRYVIHHSMPKSVEGYYQEAGRAGRDGDIAVCLLYYSFSDVMRYKRMIYMDRMKTPQTTRMHLRNLMSMVKVCEGVTECRRVQVLAYLGERYEREWCVRAAACDNCLDEHCYEQVDMSEVSKLIVRSIRENSSAAQITLLQIAHALLGSTQARLQALHNSPLNGRLSHWSREDVMRLLRQLVVNRILADEPSDNDNNPNTYVQAGPCVDKLLSGELRILFAVRLHEGGAGAAASKRARF